MLSIFHADSQLAGAHVDEQHGRASEKVLCVAYTELFDPLRWECSEMPKKVGVTVKANRVDATAVRTSSTERDIVSARQGATRLELPSVDENVAEVKRLVEQLTKQIAALEARLAKVEKDGEATFQLCRNHLRASNGLMLHSMVHQMYDRGAGR